MAVPRSGAAGGQTGAQPLRSEAVDSSVSTISFLSDFGLVDEFVGVCKSVIRQVAPTAVVIDITHDIAAHDVRAGSLALVRAVQYLADGVILAVVDPGVGTARRAVAVRAGSQILVGPDNGLLAPAVAMLGGALEAVELTNDDFHLTAPGPTFAGRDIFSPVAGYVSSGTALSDLGRAIDPVTLLPGIVPLSREEAGGIVAEVLWVDRYGNVQLNVSIEDVTHLGTVVSIAFGAQHRIATCARSYGALGAGAIGLITDSYGLLSICLDRRDASRELGLGAGMAVTLSEADDGANGTITAVHIGTRP